MQGNINNKLMIFMIVSFLAFLFVCLGYSPLLATTVIILVMAIFPLKSFPVRVGLVLILLFSLALQISSRQIFSNTADDFSNVYTVVYDNIVNKNRSPFSDFFTGGIEFGVPVLFKLLSMLFGRQNFQELMFFIVFINCFVFYLWLEYFAKKNVQSFDISFFIAVSIFVFSVAVTSQLIRQSFSTCFLLFAITFYREGKKSYILFLFVAFIFHVTALPFFFLYNVISGDNEKKKKVIAILLFLFSASFLSIATFLYGSGALGSATYKLEYYLTGGGVDQKLTIDGLKFVAGNFFFAYFLMNKDKYSVAWNFIKYGFIYYVLLIPIPLASERGLLLIVTFLPGVLLYFAFTSHRWMLKCLFVLFVFAKFIKTGFLYSASSSNVFNLWYYYPWASDDFYYFLNAFNWL